MKLSTRGFTLVELMIVIAIIGILAAALFPSLTSYLARGRDTSRVTGVREVMTATANFFTDKQAYPKTSNTAAAGGTASCYNGTELTGYMAKMPKDPIATRDTNCGTAGLYGYGTGGSLTTGVTSYLISASMENSNGGNSASGTVTFQGNGVLPATITAVDTLAKGAGATYVVKQ